MMQHKRSGGVRSSDCMVGGGRVSSSESEEKRTQRGFLFDGVPTTYTFSLKKLFLTTFLQAGGSSVGFNANSHDIER